MCYRVLYEKLEIDYDIKELAAHKAEHQKAYGNIGKVIIRQSQLLRPVSSDKDGQYKTYAYHKTVTVYGKFPYCKKIYRHCLFPFPCSVISE